MLLSISIRRFLSSFLLCAAAGLVPLFALWSSNLGQIPTQAVEKNFLYTLLFVTLVLAVWSLAVRSIAKGTLLTFITLLFVFSFGHLYNLFGSKALLGFSIGYIKFFLAWFLLYAAACFLAIRAKNVPDLRLVILPVGLLILLNAVPILKFTLQNMQPAPRSDGVSPSKVAAAQEENLPDIYYIVLDSYARKDIIQEVTGYDNSEFIDSLKARGFYVPDCAFSNYAGTVLTLTSVLNLDTLQGLNINIEGDAPYVNLIHHNRAREIFQSYGYQFVSGRGYASFNDIEDSDVYLNYAVESSIKDDLAEKRFTGLYLNTTAFRVFSELYKNNPGNFPGFPSWLSIDSQNDPSLEEANFWFSQNNYMFDTLGSFARKPGSYFVYAHINVPHGPHVYRRDGSFRYPLDDQEEDVRYVDSIIYENKRILEVVDQLLKESSPAPIIIIQGDHGIHQLTTGLDKHKILSAYYLPGELTTPPYKTITPVNNFRLILNNYLDPSVQLLPDTLWVKFLNDYEAVPAGCDLKAPGS